MFGAARSRPIPATIGTVFGGLWAFIAVMALPSAWHFPIAMLAALITALLVVRLWRTQPAATGSRPRLFGKRTYQIAVAAEVLAIYAASAVLPRFGWQEYFIQVVGVIVGLHFIGLWAATESRRFLGIAGGMCAVSAIAIPLHGSFHFIHLRDFVTGLGNAIVLWLGASQAE